MSLDDMEAAGEVEPLAHSPEELANLLQMAGRRLFEAGMAQLSAESRVVNAYQCVLASAKAMLRRLDYRVPNDPRQHFLTLQTLRFTANLDERELGYCQGLRLKRHRDEYEGTLAVSDAEAAEAVAFASKLIELARKRCQ